MSATVVVPIATGWDVLVTATSTRTTSWDVAAPDSLHDLDLTFVLLPRGWASSLAPRGWSAQAPGRWWGSSLDGEHWTSDLSTAERWEASLT